MMYIVLVFSLSKESSHHDYFSTHRKISVRSSLFAVTPLSLVHNFNGLTDECNAPLDMIAGMCV